jgi:hypothetical protein
MKSIARFEARPDLLEQVEHPGLHRDVERGDGFVGDQQLGLHHQGPGDADPLPLPPENWCG